MDFDKAGFMGRTVVKCIYRIVDSGREFQGELCKRREMGDCYEIKL